MAGEINVPGLGLFSFWDLGDNTWKDGMDFNLVVLSALAQGLVTSREAAEPGTPAAGAIYIATTNWSGAATVNALQVHLGATGLTPSALPTGVTVRGGGTWVQIVPQEGFSVFDRGADEFLVYDGTDWVPMIPNASQTPVYDVRTAFGATPGDSEVIDAVYMPRAVVFPADFAGSLGGVGVNPTSAYTIEVVDDGTVIGTINVATTGAVTFNTTGGAAQTVGAGSLLEFRSQATADATVANGNFTLAGNL